MPPSSPARDLRIEGRGYRFTVKVGAAPDPDAAKAGTKLSRGANFRCLMSGSPIAGDHIQAEGQAKRMGARLMAIVAEGARGRVYLAPTAEHEGFACGAIPEWQPTQPLPNDPRAIWCPLYGLTTFADLFTPRQLVSLTTFSDLVREATERVRHDAAAAGLPDDGRQLRDGGTGARAYADAVAAYLGMAISRFADRNNSLCTWDSGPAGTRATTGGSARGTTEKLTRSAIPVVATAVASAGLSRPFAFYSVLFPEQPTSLTPHLETAAMMTESYQPTRPTTTTSATPTCRTSSTSGFAACWLGCRNSLAAPCTRRGSSSGRRRSARSDPAGSNSSIIEERPHEAHRGELQSESETVGIAALLDCITRHVCNTFTQSCSSATRASPLASKLPPLRSPRSKPPAVSSSSATTPPAAAGIGPSCTSCSSQLRKGDVLVVWTLDRLSRSLRDVLTIMERVQERHAGFRSLKEAVDTTTPAGRMMMQMVGAFAEFERAMLKERTKAGLDAARKEGRIGGRPPKLKPTSGAQRWRPPAAPAEEERPTRRSSRSWCSGAKRCAEWVSS